MAPHREFSPRLRVLVELVRGFLGRAYAVNELLLHLLHAFHGIICIGVESTHDTALSDWPGQSR